MTAIDYAAAVLADSPLAYWKLQDASGAPQDSSGNGNHITTVDGTHGYHDPGPMSDFGIIYNGGVRSLRSPIVSSLVNNISVEYWMKPKLISANSQSIFVWDSNTTSWYSVMDTDQKMWLRLQSSTVSSSKTATVFALNSWYHVVIVRDAGTWKFYVNGAIDTANASTAAPNTPTGSATYFGAAGGSMQIVLAHIAMYGSALSAAQIAAHYSASATPSVFVPQIAIL